MKTEISLWRKIQRQNFTNIEDLSDFLNLSPQLRTQLLKAPRFPLNLPKRLASKIEKNTLNDPILKQFLPHQDELLPSSFPLDPVQDEHFRKEAKMLKKYENRALLLPTSACAMNCRFCFRQNFPYESDRSDLEKELEVIRNDRMLNEIILSGGDPLSLNDERLLSYLNALNDIPHIKRIRFHTRFPIGIPERVDDSFLSILNQSEKQVIFIIHTNHSRELDSDIFSAFRSILRLGIPVLTQTVLLKGVNDSVDALQELFENLCDHGIIPYYLHQLDRIQGASHFEVPVSKGKELISILRERLSGYALPRYVQEIPHRTSKTEL